MIYLFIQLRGLLAGNQYVKKVNDWECGLEKRNKRGSLRFPSFIKRKLESRLHVVIESPNTKERFAVLTVVHVAGEEGGGEE